MLLLESMGKRWVPIAKRKVPTIKQQAPTTKGQGPTTRRQVPTTNRKRRLQYGWYQLQKRKRRPQDGRCQPQTESTDHKMAGANYRTESADNKTAGAKRKTESADYIATGTFYKEKADQKWKAPITNASCLLPILLYGTDDVVLGKRYDVCHFLNRPKQQDLLSRISLATSSTGVLFFTIG